MNNDNNERQVEERGANAAAASSEDTAAAAAAPEEFADPLEVFMCCDVQWYSYMADTGDVYFLDMASGHSQWEDPRINGVVVIDYGAQQSYDAHVQNGSTSDSTHRTSSSPFKSPIKSPPKSPSPKSPSAKVEVESTSSWTSRTAKPQMLEMNTGLDRSNLSPASYLVEEEDSKESMLYQFDQRSVSRNFRWLDDADSTFVDDSGRKLKMEAVGRALGIAEMKGDSGSVPEVPHRYSICPLLRTSFLTFLNDF
jgi:hypothetical protein